MQRSPTQPFRHMPRNTFQITNNVTARYQDRSFLWWSCMRHNVNNDLQSSHQTRIERNHFRKEKKKKGTTDDVWNVLATSLHLWQKWIMLSTQEIYYSIWVKSTIWRPSNSILKKQNKSKLVLHPKMMMTIQLCYFTIPHGDPTMLNHINILRTQ